MKGVLIATDFLKDVDGNFKVLETNTNINLAIADIENYFDINSFDQFIQENEITKIDIINQSLAFSNFIDLEHTNPEKKIINLFDYIFVHYSGTSITVTLHNQSENSVTVPFIEDEPDRLILRSAYDTTALIDDSYAKDNFQFLKLLYDQDQNSIPKTYISNVDFGFDSIGLNIRDNGIHPNFIIKQRFPTTNYNEYPKILKITTEEELTELKNTLPENTLLQEFIIDVNNTILGKLPTYRSVDMIYGSDLNVFHMVHPYCHTNFVSINETTDYKENGHIQVWEKPKYQQKLENKNDKITLKRYKVDDDSIIWAENNDLLTVNDITVGTQLKTVSLPNLPLDENQIPLIDYFIPYSSFTLNDITVTGTTVVDFGSINTVPFWSKEITLDNGLIFEDAINCSVLSKKSENDEIRFYRFEHIEENDTIFLVNKETEQIEEMTVASVSYKYVEETIYSMDVEDIDLYLTLNYSTDTPSYAIIQHNPQLQCDGFACNYGSYWYCSNPCGVYGYSGTYYSGCFCCNGYPYCDYGSAYYVSCSACQVKQ